MKTGIKAILFASVLLIISCTAKFDKQKWQDSDVAFPSEYRPAMLPDLIQNHKLIGLTTKQLNDLLGPEDHTENYVISYNIIIKYGRDTDPIYTKKLKLNFSKDSLVTEYKVAEWSAE